LNKHFLPRFKINTVILNSRNKEALWHLANRILCTPASPHYHTLRCHLCWILSDTSQSRCLWWGSLSGWTAWVDLVEWSTRALLEASGTSQVLHSMTQSTLFHMASDVKILGWGNQVHSISNTKPYCDISCPLCNNRTFRTELFSEYCHR
jgi:hypothetical protein